MKTLIVGGTGLVGKNLIKVLLEYGHEPILLSRKKNSKLGIQSFIWNVDSSYIEDGAFDGVDYLIYLAGENIAEKRWSDDRKKQIIDSRVKGLELINKYLIEHNIVLKGIISASAIGYYGADRGEEILDENSSEGNDFLSETVIQWEKSVWQMKQVERRVALRIGLVLSSEGGALEKFTTPLRLGIAPILGDGKQWISWIHIDDLCEMFVYFMQNGVAEGVINAVAPNPIRNSQMMREIAQVYGKAYFFVKIPKFLIKLIFGEMGNMVLGSNFVVNNRMRGEMAFIYRFQTLNQAIIHLQQNN